MNITDKQIRQITALSKELSLAKAAYEKRFQLRRRFNLADSFETYGTPEHKELFRCLKTTYFAIKELEYEKILDLEALADLGSRFCRIRDGVICEEGAEPVKPAHAQAVYNECRAYFRSLFPTAEFSKEAVLFLLWKPIHIYLPLAADLLRTD